MNLRNQGAQGVMVVSAAFALSAFSANAQTVTVVEYYNKAVDAYFITGRANEQAGLDSVSDFARTGMTFQATVVTAATAAQTKICRFYISVASPYTSSHFYGRQGTDCEYLLSLGIAGFSWEDYDFATQQPSSGVCPAGTAAIYRGFRAGAGGKTSNHRYSASPTNYNAAVTAGYVGEGPAFCVTAATAVSTSPPVSGASDCGDLFTSNKRVTMTYSDTEGGSYSYVRTFDATPVAFQGQTAGRVISADADGNKLEQFLVDGGSAFTEIGERGTSSTGPVRITTYTPPVVYPKVTPTGHVITYTRVGDQSASIPGLQEGNFTQTGTFTQLGRESVTVPAGTFMACKYTHSTDASSPAINGRLTTSTTQWHASGVGLLRIDGTLNRQSIFGIVGGSYQMLATKIE